MQVHQKAPVYDAFRHKPLINRINNRYPSTQNHNEPGATGAQRKLLRFSSQDVKKAGKNGLFITPDRLPANSGGLSMVSLSIPRANNEFGGKDIRVIQPWLKPMAEKDKCKPPEERAQPTGIVKTLLHNGKIIPFEIMQHYEKDSKTWVYSVKSKLFDDLESLFTYGTPNPKTKKDLIYQIGEDPVFQAVMLFNRAAAEFAPELNASKPQPPGVNLHQFEGDADFAIVNDWLTGPFLSQLAPDYDIGKIFMLHNQYDQARDIEQATRTHLAVPDFLKRLGTYSPLGIGIQLADVVIADPNFARSLTWKLPEKAQGWALVLKDKLAKGLVFPMHHAPGNKFDPVDNPNLRTPGFTTLKPNLPPEEAIEEVKRFKLHNKLAYQKMIGLKEDPNAVLFNWTARFDPFQKGCMILFKNLKDFMKANPQVQVVFFSPGATGKPAIDKLIQGFIRELETDKDLKGRCVNVGKVERDEFPSRLILAKAASHFHLLPSVYEPYGLTQLEAMKLGTLAVGHGVDGILSSVSDPDMPAPKPAHQAYYQHAHHPPTTYGQTGILMPRFDTQQYPKALAKFFDLKAGNPIVSWVKSWFNRKNKAILQEAEASFKEALNRALALAKDPDKMAQAQLNAMNYINTVHSWDHLVKHKYNPAIQKAVEFFTNRQSLKTPAAAPGTPSNTAVA